MAQSFAGEYRLCVPCFNAAERAGGVQGFDPANKNREDRWTVFASVFGWLKATERSR